MAAAARRGAEVDPDEAAGVGGLEGDAVLGEEGGGQGVVLREAALALGQEAAHELGVLEERAGHVVEQGAGEAVGRV